MAEEKRYLKEKVLGTLDVNGDGQIDIQDIIFQRGQSLFLCD